MLKYIFPWIRLKTPNLKWYKKLNIYIESLLFITIIAWILWLNIGLKFVFSNEYSYNNIHFFMPNEFTKSEKEKLDEVIIFLKETLSNANININSINANVFIEKEDLYYKLSLVPGMQFIPSATAVTLGNYIFLPNANIIKQLLTSQKGHSNNLSLVLAHELIHVWQNNTYARWLNPSFLSRFIWYIEGYAVYLTDDPIMYDQNVIETVFKNPIKINRFQKGAYALWGLMVKHAIEKMHKSVDDLHLGKVDYDEVLDSLLREYNVTKGSD